ncbi:glycosyltransferase family 4 protein [uncultured Polaribacter sp.]|uniref:glycosyltransferase family 4 protein n=1 Tax=uncultured Polaribacter sp. TaxID=174711 RepID=UPI0026049A5F|nr:glycosyltransferase family 4 protein [uncultured Polaribacter sp.]
MKNKNKFLLVGPFPDPVSGVSLANKIVLENLESSKSYKADFVNTSYPVFEDAIGSFSIKKALFFVKINVKALKVFKNDIIYITPGQTFFGIAKYTLFILLSSILKKEIIIHVHGNYLGKQYSELSGIKKKFFYFLISKFTKGIILSRSLKNNLSPFLKTENIHVLNNFAQDFLYYHTEEKSFRELKICYLSNLMEEKGILQLLDALIILEEKKISYSAKIAGNIDENLKEIIRNKISSLKNTQYLGIVKGIEKRELLNWSTIFVLPTFYKMEGQPISILEAMATSNVIISTKHAGIPDIIKHEKNGFLMETNKVDELVEFFTYLDENRSKIKQISEYNKTYFINNFTVDIFESEFLKIINNSAKTEHF